MEIETPLVLSDSHISKQLAFAGVAVEYTRESPLFLQQINAFEESYNQFPAYCRSVLAALQEYDCAIATMQEASTKLAEAINGRSGGFGRALFTNAFPHMGDLGDTLRTTSDALGGMNSSLQNLREGLVKDVVPILEDLSKEDFTHERRLKREYEDSFYEYEALLDSALQTRARPSDEALAKITSLRSRSELQRFDLVTRINHLDCAKKLELTQSSCGLFYLLGQFAQSFGKVCADRDDFFEHRKNASLTAEKIMFNNVTLYGGLRSRLQGELMGALPPPGAPPGALSPVQPRSHLGMLPFTTLLTTEVLSRGTRSASYEDVRHARDDGIYKQGYLFTPGGIFVRRRRKWHRLYGTKLYIMEAVSNAPSCNMEIVCDVLDSTVCAKPGEMPHKFIIATSGGSRIELQAENEDEMVKWISALRRCAFGSIGKKDSTIKLEENDVSIEIYNNNPTTALLVKQFVKKNMCCAECRDEPVAWISTSLGVTLCEECASVHRTLTWAVSKLKSIKYDELSKWQIDLLNSELGNTAANQAWEKCVPEGWTKPEPDSPLEDKAQWILAKYRWYGFVDEFRVRSDEHLTSGIMEAAATGSVSSVLFWLTHKADVNCSAPDTGCTPLHEAISGSHVQLTAFLLVNGADIYAKNKEGRSPLDLSASKSCHKDIAEMMLLIQRGDY